MLTFYQFKDRFSFRRKSSKDGVAEDRTLPPPYRNTDLPSLHSSDGTSFKLMRNEGVSSGEMGDVEFSEERTIPQEYHGAMANHPSGHCP